MNFHMLMPLKILLFIFWKLHLSSVTLPKPYVYWSEVSQGSHVASSQQQRLWRLIVSRPLSTMIVSNVQAFAGLSTYYHSYTLQSEIIFFSSKEFAPFHYQLLYNVLYQSSRSDLQQLS